MTERRFTEEEVAAIFERASTAQPADSRALVASEGMTLAQLQDIGREVGIAPELIQRAAHSIDYARAETSQKIFGLPIGVSHVVELPRKLSDDEWERLVVDLRETFDARGTVRSDGSLRQWTNGNLHVFLEPTATGQRIRFRTMKGSAMTAMGMGAMFIGIAMLGVVAAFLKKSGVETGLIAGMGVFAAMGTGAIAFGAGQLPAWARTRRRQMQDIAARVSARLL